MARQVLTVRADSVRCPECGAVPGEDCTEDLVELGQTRVRQVDTHRQRAAAAIRSAHAKRTKGA